MSPAVSIIIGTYNCARYLPGLWTCLDAQTFRNYEIVVVDDASDDGETVPALEARGDRIRLIRRESNSATCERPRYEGVRASRAPLCAFLDADDRWDPVFLERCVAYMDRNPDAALVHTYVRVVDAEGRTQRIRHENVMPEGEAMKRALLEHCYITISATVARRDIWLHAVPENEINDFGMDQDFFLNIAKQHRIGFIPEVLASYRRSDTSVSEKKWRRAPRNVNTLERICRKRMWAGVTDKGEMMRIRRGAYIENAEYWHHKGHPVRALWFCAQGLRRDPLAGSLWSRAARTLFGWVRS